MRRAGQGLVHAVVDDLPEAVHEPPGVRRADVHAGSLAHGLESFEDEEVGGVVRVVDRGLLRRETEVAEPVLRRLRIYLRHAQRRRRLALSWTGGTEGLAWRQDQQHRTTRGRGHEADTIRLGTS